MENQEIKMAFDTIEPEVVLNNMHIFNIKVVAIQPERNGNFFMVYKGKYSNMEKLYNKFYNNGDSFLEYRNNTGQ